MPATGATSVTVALSIRGGAEAGSVSVLPGGATAGRRPSRSPTAPNQVVEAMATVDARNGGRSGCT